MKALATSSGRWRFVWFYERKFMRCYVMIGLPLLLAASSLAGCNRSAIQPPVVTLDEYNQVKPGMTYQQVVSVVGAPETSKFPDPDPRVKNQYVYVWANADGSKMSLVVKDEKVITPSQLGLK